MHQSAKGFNWRIERGKIILADRVRVVPQRSFREDWNGRSDRPPRSYGIAPVGIGADGAIEDEVIIPLPETEVSWLGLEPVDRHSPSVVRVFISSIYRSADFGLADDDADDVWSENGKYTSSPAFAIKGIYVNRMWRPFGKWDSPTGPIFERIAITVEQLGSATSTPGHSAKAPGRGGSGSTKFDGDESRGGNGPVPLSRVTVAFVELRTFLEFTGTSDLKSLQRSQGYQDWLLP